MLPLLLLLLLCLTVATAGITLPWNDDVLGLIVFKADLGNPAALHSWIEDDQSPCAWYGIQCSSTGGRVVGISLDGLSLTGTLGRGLLKLDQLESLSLSMNNISGGIPLQIQVLQSLRLLNLGHNSLSGAMPHSLGSLPSLWRLDLSHNQLQGQLPRQIGALSRLRSLDLSHNALSGALPQELLQCSQLEELHLSYNMFTGPPPALPSGLTTLQLESNFLSGAIPAWLANFTRLSDLNLGLNQLQGPIPMATLSSLPSLQGLRLSGNRLQGDIPAAQLASSCTNLSDIDLSGNRFTGPVPVPLLEGLQLVNLALSGNALTGELPQLSSLACQSLQRLDLSDNMLHGEVQLQFVQCSKLASLNLAGNTFQGSIPPELATLPKLNLLDLSDNAFTGFLPASFENATSLTGLFVHGNMLQGAIPIELGTCQSLAFLDLSYNNFTGGIPVELSDLSKLEVLDLSQNHLSGQIPASFGELRNLTVFNVSHNSLAGPLPVNGVFQRMDPSSFEGNLHLCGAPLKLECPAIPKPIVLDPNATGNSSPIIGGAGNGGNSKNSNSSSSRSRIVLSVSAIVAISAAALIALGIVVVSLLNLGKQQQRARMQRPRSSFYVVDSSLPPGSSPSEDVAIGKLVMFTDDSNNDEDDMSNDELLPQAQALLNKDSELGRGCFGTVYRATLAAGRAVAVKKLTVTGLVQSQNEFEKRVQFLGRIQHPNLVNFQGYYWTPKLQLLIYDYIAGGSLHSRLHDKQQLQQDFPWEDRLKVALGAAAGLVYLHHRCKPRVVHSNFKSANVLLDDHGNARVSDYGLIKLLASPRRRHEVTSKQQGALGYMAPECTIASASSSSSFKATDRSDVYAFGVMLLELVTGKMPLEYTEDDLVLVSDRCRCAVDYGRPFDCVDPRMGSYPEDEVLTVMKLGLVCTSHTPSNRPTMAQVMQILELIKPLAPPGSGSSSA